MLGQRRRRLSNIKSELGQRLASRVAKDVITNSRPISSSAGRHWSIPASPCRNVPASLPMNKRPELIKAGENLKIYSLFNPVSGLNLQLI